MAHLDVHPSYQMDDEWMIRYDLPSGNQTRQWKLPPFIDKCLT